MDNNKLDKFRDQLQQHKENLTECIHGNHPEAERILGVQSIEEFNVEAIEQNLVIQKIDQALERIGDGTFGKCNLCSGEVEEERLALDFTTCVCLDHYSESQLKELEQDLELAAKVQKQLFPQKVPFIAGVQLAVRSEPSKIVGGDYFDFFAFRKKSQAFAIADVMGKGLPASMLMSNLQASLRILGPENRTLQKTVTRLNELFRYNLKTIRFITLFTAAIDMEKHKLIYCNAGHNPPLWFKYKTNKVDVLNPTGPALGIFSEPVFKSKQVQFSRGDIFLFYTDGLTEAKNEEAEFGEERLQNFLAQNHHKTAQQILSQLFKTVKEHSKSDPDDMTAIVMKIE
jgi:sigma-B regulation protein RsbU (phosphoserine phosphatase)